VPIKKKRNYSAAKAAFDSTMHHYRAFNGLGSISAVNMGKQSGKGASPDPSKPTPLDFRCDVDKVLLRVVPKKYLTRFVCVYILHECLTSIEQEMLADRTIGGARHSIEQRVGGAFIERGIKVTGGRGYFHHIRKSRPR
jgi:hypothetical protein